METAKEHSQAARYLVALLAPAVVAGVMLLSWPLFEGSPITPFLLAIMLTSWYGGFRPGLLSVLSSVLLADFFFIAPYFSLGPASRLDFIRLILLTIVGVGCSALSEMTHRATSRVESILSGVADVHILFDRKWRYLYVNHAAVRALGRPAEEVLGRTLWEIYPDIVGTELDRQYRRAMDESLSVSFDFYYAATETWWTCRFSPAPEGLAVFATDITERKRAEEKLREHEKVVEGLEEMIVVVDREYRYLIANRAFLKLHELKEEQVIGHLITDILGKEYFEKFIKDNLDRSFQGELLKFETKYTYPGLGERGLFITYLPIEGPAGIDRVACVLADRTDARRAEKAHREAERKYRDIFENAGEGIFQSTPEGRFIEANPELARMQGFDSPEELIRSRNDITNQIYVDPGKREEFQRLLEQHGIVRGFEHQIFCKDGSRIWISVNARAVRDEQGEINYYEGTAQDITKRKRAEARSVAFATLARKLSGARNQLDAGRIIAEIAADLFGWDSYKLDLYDADQDIVHPMLNVDMIDGKQVDVTAFRSNRLPTAGSRRVFDHGPELFLLEAAVPFGPDTIPSGDKSLPSGSLMKVPIRHASKVIGLLSIQSGLHVYDQAALGDLEALADHCGEALNRIRAEESLYESEERFRQLAENLEDVIWITDRGLQNVLYINSAYEKIFRRTRDSVYQDLGSFLETVHPDDRQSVEDMLAGERNGRHLPFEYRIIRPDTTIRWIHRRSFPIRNDEGEIHLIAGIGQDITERKRAQEELRESEERYRDLVENSRELICTHDLEGLVLSANPAAAEAMGYDLDELVGKKTIRDILAPEVRHQFGEYMAQLCKDGATSGIMYVQTRSGEQRVWDYHNSLRTEGVATPVVRGMARDITEERRAQKALRESEERYRELFENARDALYVHDLSGRYTSFNRAAEELSGYSRDEILGKHFSNFVAPRSLKDARTNLCKKLDLEGETTYEIELIKKDRSRVPVEVSSRLIYEKGRPVGIQGVARDITDRKRAREALRTYSQRLIEAQEAERQVIARELHDEIGQVLTAVRINLQSLGGSAQPDSQSLALDDSLIIVDEALARVRELSLNLRPSVLDNLGLSSALRWYVDRYAQRSGIVAALKSDLQEGRRLRVELETACFRIVQEALTNVARHARATQVRVVLTSSNGTLNLKIKDNGIGFNVDALLKDSPPAQALGLRGMEERAVAARGSFKIDSASMRGTEVSVSLPLRNGS